MAGHRFAYLCALLGALVFYFFYPEWFSWFVWYTVLWLPAIGLLLSLPAICTSRFALQAPKTIPQGQAGRCSLSLAGKLPPPLFRSRMAVKHAISGKVWTLRPGEVLPSSAAGRLDIRPVRARVYDYLGLFRLPMRPKATCSVLIWPREIPINPTPDFALQVPRQWKPKPGGGFSENYDLRLYRPGDNLHQIHWKLSAKTGKRILREAIEPVHRRIRLALDLCGAPEELNRKLGRLLWLGNLLLQRELPYDISALTGNGIFTWPVSEEKDLQEAMTALLGMPAATGGSIVDIPGSGWRQYLIGGEPDEA